ncbi:hypothetical protein DB30_06573 [Enhygromyxa salina]|uniref:Uncharacterized protein n=1 Tax=Enhygromyxa salina TaxID=215803 RepID=A0A0C2DH08_9BACT|nr:hypothetical protein [Enhygromyxa salina]KIG18962.1 hypothetical protein DB30_06573 [Enhygromyxa salina]
MSQRSSPAPSLSSDDEALLASLLAEDPSDFHVERARIWRMGPARWAVGGFELPHHPPGDPRGVTSAQPLEAVIVDPAGPRVLLPLEDLAARASPSAVASAWSALRLIAVLSPGDLVAGLKRELRPTPWLTVSAGVGLSPISSEDDHLRARWADPACGFSLELALDTQDFGPLYEPGPAGPPSDAPEPAGTVGHRLAPGTEVFVAADAREPILHLDPATPGQTEHMSAGQRVILEGAPSRGRQAISLRCRGVQVRGFVSTKAIIETTTRYAVVADTPPPSSSCAGFEAESIAVPRATPLYEPTGTADAVLVGVVANDVELLARPGTDGWWAGCVGSPWGDLLFQFRLR